MANTATQQIVQAIREDAHRRFGISENTQKQDRSVLVIITSTAATPDRNYALVYATQQEVETVREKVLAKFRATEYVLSTNGLYTPPPIHEAIRRENRYPGDFMFQLTDQEAEALRVQHETPDTGERYLLGVGLEGKKGVVAMVGATSQDIVVNKWPGYKTSSKDLVFFPTAGKPNGSRVKGQATPELIDKDKINDVKSPT